MQLKILDQVFTFKNEPAALDEIFTKINQFLDESGLVLSHLRVDDTEVFADYYDYLKERIDRINLVEVEVRTVAGILRDALLTAEEYLEQALPEIETLAAEFYQGPSGESWDKFQQLLDGVDWINQLVAVIDQSATENRRWQDYLAVAGRLGMNSGPPGSAGKPGLCGDWRFTQLRNHPLSPRVQRIIKDQER